MRLLSARHRPEKNGVFGDESDIPSLRRHLFAVLALALLVSAIYSNTLHVPFHFDDFANISFNRNIFMTDLSWGSIKNTFYGTNQAGTRILRPVAFLSLGLNYYFGGLDTFGYHVVNLAIHFLAALFLYLTVYETLRLPRLKTKYGSSAYSVALLTAVLWAAHPIQIQAVTYVVQRMASMAALFYLAALFFYVKSRLPRSGMKWSYFFLFLACALLAFGTKENAAVLPAAIILYEFTFLQEELTPRKKKGILLIAGLVLVLPVVLVIYFQGPDVFHRLWNEILKGYPNRDFTPYERVLTQFRVVLYYITLLVYPSPGRLSLDYDYPISHSLLDPPATLIAAAAIAIVIFLATLFARKTPILSFSILWYFLNLFVESSIFNLELVFEHRLYLPSMWLFLPLSIGIVRAAHMSPGAKIPVLCLAGALVFAEGCLTFTRNSVWQSHYSLWQDCFNKAPGKARTVNNLGLACYEAGRTDEAEKYLSMALRKAPKNAYAHNTIGCVYLRKQQYDKSLAAYRLAGKCYPTWSMPVLNQGHVYYRLGDLDKAEKEYRRALSIYEGPNGYIALGRVLHAKKHFSEALDSYRMVPQNHPACAKALFHMGLVRKDQGMYKEALHCIEESLKRIPADKAALLEKAGIHARLGQHRTAASLYEQLLRRHPLDFEVNLGAGKFYVGSKDYPRAKVCLRTAASVSPAATEPHLCLSSLYMKTDNPALADYYDAAFRRRDKK
ncbi:MAG: tetratricopeptide repeat protein [Pseudomonadota bacterium]